MDIHDMEVRPYEPGDVVHMARIWNQVVERGKAFPQTETLSESEAREFFAAQTACGVAADKRSGSILGLYILHPNNIGRCGHIANASFAVAEESRGMHIGEKLVLDCLKRAKLCGFRLLQFNAVVGSNIHAQHLYERLGFTRLGRIPGGFKNIFGEYEDIFVYYIAL